MARRRYVRDNRGRFASTGATARGGRLRTASGKKRETQTMKVSGGGVAGTIGKPKGLKPGTIKSKPKVLSAREQAANRLKIKTATRRKLKTDRESVIPSTPKGPKTMKARRIGLTVSKPRTKGNAPAQIASRVRRKNAANEAGLKRMGRYGNIPKPSTYNRAIKRANTLKRADAYLKTGKLPGKDNSIRAQRELKAAKQRLNAKNAARRADRAESNIPMRGSRGRKLDAEISRNVTQQRALARTQDRAMNRQFKSDQSRAKALRGKYGDQLAKDFAAKSGKKVSEVKAAIKGMAPSQQVKLLTQAGRQQRAQANLARTADTRNKPGSTMIRRPSAKQSKSNRRAQTAVDIYSSSGSKRSQIIRNQGRLARTERARNNQMRTREARLAEAKATGLPMIKVTKPKRRKLK